MQFIVSKWTLLPSDSRNAFIRPIGWPHHAH